MTQVVKSMHPLGPRVLGIAGVVVTLAIIVAFMAIPFLAWREPAPAGDYRLGALMASPDVKVFPNGTYLLTLTLRDGAGELADTDPISVSVEMAGMEPRSVDMSRVTAGVYRGAGLFPMAGRWVFTVEAAGGTAQIPAGPGQSF